MKAILNCGHVIDVSEKKFGYYVCPECTKEVEPDGVAMEAVREFVDDAALGAARE